MVDEARSRIEDRARAQLYRARYRLARSTGATPDLRHAERTLGPAMRRAAQAYDPPTLPMAPGTVVLYAASMTDPAETVVPWSAHHPGLDVVELDGAHFRPEADCIMRAAKVGALADDLGARLRR